MISQVFTVQNAKKEDIFSKRRTYGKLNFEVPQLLQSNAPHLITSPICPPVLINSHSSADNDALTGICPVAYYSIGRIHKYETLNISTIDCRDEVSVCFCFNFHYYATC